jgi:uncharacterized membrane protein
MQELWWQLQTVSPFTVYLSLGFAAAVCLFIHEIVKAPMLAWLSTPILVAGGVLAPTLLGQQTITLSYDKTVNSVLGTASGTLAALMLILLTNWLWAHLVEYRVSRTKLTAIPTRPRRIR